jgi:L-lactate dehydrogenase complex protein LldG
MSTSARSEILARVRKASRGSNAESLSQQLQGLGVAPAAPLPCADLATAFLTNVLKNQGSAAVVSGRSEAVKAVGAYLYKHFRSHRLVAGNDPHLAAMPWRDAGVLPRFGSIEPGEPAALSYAMLGIAETGAIVTFTGKSSPASNNLLSEHHIVLVDQAKLVANMEQAWLGINREIERVGRPRGINFIAGPSSTGDIEGKLVYGAHGPRGWHVILIGEALDSALQEARELAGLA